MNPSWLSSLGGAGDCQWGDGADSPREGRARPDVRRVHRRLRVARKPYQLSPGEESQRRIHRETQRQRSLHTACALTSVTSLTPSCGPHLLLTQYQRLSQLVRYTAFLEDATSALVRELGVRLNFDFSPVTRYIRRMKYQAQMGSGAFDFAEDEAEEVMKLVDTMSAGGSGQQRVVSGWSSQGAASSTAAGPPTQPEVQTDGDRASWH